MGKIRRTYTIQFKQQLVQQIESGLIMQKAAAQRYAIDYCILSRWREQFREGKLVDGSGRAEVALIEENLQLKRKIGELVMEIEMLKKIDPQGGRRKNVPSWLVTARDLGPSPEDARSWDSPEAPITIAPRKARKKKPKRT